MFLSIQFLHDSSSERFNRFFISARRCTKCLSFCQMCHHGHMKTNFKFSVYTLHVSCIFRLWHRLRHTWSELWVHSHTPDSPPPPFSFHSILFPGPPQITLPGSTLPGTCLFSFLSWRTSNLGESEAEQMTTGFWPFLPQFNSSPPCPLNVAISLGRSDTLIWAWSGRAHNRSVTLHLCVRGLWGKRARNSPGIGDGGGCVEGSTRDCC